MFAVKSIARLRSSTDAVHRFGQEEGDSKAQEYAVTNILAEHEVFVVSIKLLAPIKCC